MEKLIIDEFQYDAQSSEDEVSEICTVPPVKEKKDKQRLRLLFGPIK